MKAEPSDTPGATTLTGKNPPVPAFDLSTGLSSGDVLEACREFGCFNITGPVIDPLLTQALLRQMETFFALDDSDPVKQAVHRSRNCNANGWTPMLEEPAYKEDTIAWVESFDCVLSRERLACLPPQVRDGILPSIWPAVPGFRDTVRQHWDGLIETAASLFPVVSEMLGQNHEFLSAHASSQALNTMRLLHYPERRAIADPVNVGIAPHTDFECITLIHQTAPGLEVQSPAGKWQQVAVAEGQWTVLIGEMVEIWSNGAIPATPHRVPTTPWERYSVVMFLAADPGLEIRPLDAFVDTGRPARFDPVTQDQQIDVAMARAEKNRQAMRPEVEKILKGISPG